MAEMTRVTLMAEMAEMKQMKFRDRLIILRGGGDLGTGAAWELNQAGFPVVIYELPEPLAIRRRVSFSTAVSEGRIEIEGLRGVLVSNPAKATKAIDDRTVPVLVSPPVPAPAAWPRWAVVDARLAKHNIDTRAEDASLVIGLGPGFNAGQDCHAVIETNRGPELGRVIWEGAAQSDTGIPGEIAGHTADRVIKAPVAGRIRWRREIGDIVAEADLLGWIDKLEIMAPLGGTVRGLIADDRVVSKGLKIADLDPRSDRSLAFRISDKAHAVGTGVGAAALAWMSR